MSLLIYIVLGLSPLLWLVLAKKILGSFKTRYFLSEDEITTAYSKYDQNRHRPTSWAMLATFQFFSLISLSFFVSMVIGVMFGLVISFIYVFLGNLFITLPMSFVGLYLGALEKTESPLHLLSQKKSMRVIFSIYVILFAAFSVFTFSLLMVNLLPAAEAIIIVMGFAALFLLLEGWERISESTVSGVGVVLLIGTLGCGILVQQRILGDNFMEYLVLASILLVMIAYTELSSATQRISFLLLSFVVIAFFLVLSLSFLVSDFFHIQIIDIKSLKDPLLWPKNVYGNHLFVNQNYSILQLLPVVMIPSVASGFLAIISWQSTAKQIESDSDISRVAYLSTFLFVVAQLLVLIFVFSMYDTTPAISDLLLSENFFTAALETESARRLVYIAVACMTLLIVAPAFRVAAASLPRLFSSGGAKGVLYLLIGGGTFLFIPQFRETHSFLFLTVFGSASVGVSAIYMALASSYFKSEELESKLLTLIVFLLFASSIVGFLLVIYNLLPNQLFDGSPRLVILILAVIALISEIILVIKIQTGLGGPIPSLEMTPTEEDQNDYPTIPSPKEATQTDEVVPIEKD